MAEASFDLENALHGKNRAEIVKPVFITGLARSGTTILLEYLYKTGCFSTLTYRDMPFVLMPDTWRRLSRNKHRETYRERAHGDGMMIGPDSPEAFEEVFWRVFCGKEYIKQDRLLTHGVDPEVSDKFQRFIAQVLSGGVGKRYLSKNNNNILRLNYLTKTFPGAKIIVPFREPSQHAGSLLSQHLRFCELQQKDKFTLDYMNWLGHHEFGLDQKPFYLGDGALFETVPGYQKTDINFWLHSWKNYYAHLLQQPPNDLILFDYDAFCESPDEVLTGLFSQLAITRPVPEIIPFKKSSKHTEGVDKGLLDECLVVYKTLKERAGAL